MAEIGAVGLVGEGPNGVRICPFICVSSPKTPSSRLEGPFGKGRRGCNRSRK